MMERQLIYLSYNITRNVQHCTYRYFFKTLGKLNIKYRYDETRLTDDFEQQECFNE